MPLPRTYPNKLGFRVNLLSCGFELIFGKWEIKKNRNAVMAKSTLINVSLARFGFCGRRKGKPSIKLDGDSKIVLDFDLKC